MSTLSAAATAQPSNNPPRVKVDVTDSGTPAITQVQVVRKDASGNTTPVRTPDGGPLQLVTSGSNRVGTVFDYEAPFGQPFTYATVEQPANASSSVTLVGSSVWLVHPGVPARSVAVELRKDSLESEERTVSAGVFYPLGRTNPVVVTDGRRKGRSSSLTVGTETLAQLASLHALIDDAGVLFLNVPPGFEMGVDSSYIFVRDVQVKRLSDIGSAPQRDVVMPYVVVDRPAGGQQAVYTWGDVIAKYPTWQALMDANATWTAVQSPS